MGKQKGFSVVAVLFVIVLILVVGGGYLYLKGKNGETINTPAVNEAASGQNQAVGEPSIAMIFIGDERLPDGATQYNQKTIFSVNTPKIYVSPGIENPQKDMTVKVELFYLTKNTKVLDVVSPLNGGNVARFNFSAPTKGWPAGDYRLDITLSTGQKSNIGFKVE